MTDYTSPIELIVADFDTKRIPIEAPGFYDHPNFKAFEKTNPAYLDNYAMFVQRRPFDENYADHVHRVVPVVTRELSEDIGLRQSMGECAGASMAMSRMLELHGVWNYIVKGALTISVQPPGRVNPVYFWPIDFGEFDPAQAAAHVWVVAPPYIVVDPTIKAQPYDTGTGIAPYLPDWVLAEHGTPVTAMVEDIFSPNARRQLVEAGVPESDWYAVTNPKLPTFFQHFPACQVGVRRALFKYIPCGIAAPDGFLAGMYTPDRPLGYYLKLYEEKILPLL